MSWLLYPPYTLAFLVIVVLGAIGVLAVRKREAVMAYGSGCGLLLIATLVYLFTAVLSGFACANNPCGGTVSVLLTYAAPPFIASIFTGLAAVGLLIFGAVTDWQGRDNVRAGATATTTRSTAVAQSRLSQRRAIDARAQQIVEESGALWAVARDQARAEMVNGEGFGGSPPGREADPDGSA